MERGENNMPARVRLLIREATHRGGGEVIIVRSTDDGGFDNTTEGQITIPLLFAPE